MRDRKQCRQRKHQQNQNNRENGKENNSMDISNDKKAWICLRKRNLKRENESLLIAVQNNAIRTISK